MSWFMCLFYFVFISILFILCYTNSIALCEPLRTCKDLRHTNTILID